MGRKNSKKRKTKEKSSAAKVYKGTVDMTRSGVAYIIVENLDSDIMVRQQGLNTALHGDMVWVEITKGKEGVGRMQGEVNKVVTRKRKEFVGRIEMNKGFAFFIPEIDRPMPDIYIPQENIGEAKNNERVVVRLVEWESSDKRPVGEVVHVLNIENENDLAMKEILLDSGFPLQFSDEAMEVAARIPETITEDEISKRKDCRSILTFTIDPVDAKDFDDALSFRPLKNGNYEIGVHIADVSHYVETETELDKEAYERATSVYLPDRVNPMLPEHISNFLCSLRPKEDKLTFSAIFQLTPKGDVKQYWLGKTVIHSDHRFTYEDVQEMIEGKEGPHKEELLLLNEMAQRMRKQRFKNGAINFSSQEVRFKLDEKGKPIGILIKESKEAHQLIEEFMLLANRKVAEHLSKIKIHNKPLPVPYRIHDDPDEEKLVPFVAFAKKFGHKFDMSSPDKIAESFNQLLKDAHGKPEQHVLEQLGIRTMAKAKYTIENVGHYGLGFEHYCHFTSPIRRYPDVLIHRVLQQSLIEAIVVDKKMEEKCKHCSERERAAMESERAANKYKQVEYMKDYLGEEFEGVISGVAAFGFWVETIEHKCEGLVSLNSLLDFDTFHHDQTDYCLTGQRSGKKFRMGDKVMIKVVAANLTKRQLDYEWVVEEAKTKKSKTKNAK